MQHTGGPRSKGSKGERMSAPKGPQPDGMGIGDEVRPGSYSNAGSEERAARKRERDRHIEVISRHASTPHDENDIKIGDTYQ